MVVSVMTVLSPGKFTEIRSLVPLVTVDGIIRNIKGDILILERLYEPFEGEF